MYTVDSFDQVVELKDLPQSSVGAPCPMVLAGENHLHLAYYLQDTSQSWDGQTVRSVGEDSPGESVALVTFERARAHLFGPPNDEAFEGHPLASRGLEPYAVHEILHSSWIRALERMNSVHPCHRPEFFDSCRHFIFAFHDRTFECIADSFSLSLHTASVAAVLGQALQIASRSEE